ncbi:MAG: hypothetical protein WB992_15495 [Bryobacteraceae bacterium]
MSQADYDWFAAASPSNPDVVYLGAIALWKGELRADGTWKWLNISSREQGDSIHGDQHAIAFSPEDAETIYVGNDGGIFKSPNGGRDWQSLNKGLSITHFEYVAQHPEFDAWLLGGTQDNGTLRYEGGDVWYQVAVGDGGECATNDSFPYTVYHCFYGMSLERSITGGGYGSWSSIAPPVPGDYSALFYPPLEVNGNIVALAGKSCYVSTDSGSTFNELSLPVDAGRATALAIVGPFRFFVGTESGDIFQFDWVALSWTNPTTLSQPRAGFISSIRIDPSRPTRLWVTYSDVHGPTIYRSDDGGNHWQAYITGLPIAPVNIVEMHSWDSNIIFAGTDVGVWRSADAGATWMVFSTGLPNAIVGDLVFHPKMRLLRAATRSRGVWEVDLSGQAVPDPQIYLRHTVVDTGRDPSVTGAEDPFDPNGSADWRDSPDILIDSAPYQTPSIADVDFVAFEEARRAGVHAVHGLTRVFVQVHQRGTVPAANAVVYLYFAHAMGDSLPLLPSGFWENFPSTAVPAGSAWDWIGPGMPVNNVHRDRPQISAFEWDVAERFSQDTIWLLALVTADNDRLNTTELDVSILVPQQAKCALKRISLSR